MSHGFSFDAQSTRRIAGAVQTVEDGARDLTGRPRPREHIAPANIIAKTTTIAATGGLYDAVQAIWNGSTFETLSVGRTWGTGSGDLVRLREINGNENIDIGTFARVFPVATVDGIVQWFFQAVDAFGQLDVCTPALPDEVPDLFSDHQADDIVGLSDTDPLTTWLDSKGSQDFTQGTGANKPLFRTGQCGGEATSEYDGDDFLDNSSKSAYKFIHNGSAMTFLIAFKFTGIESTNRAEFLGNSAGTTANVGFICTYNDTSNFLAFSIQDGNGNQPINKGFGTGITQNTCLVLAVRHTPSQAGVDNDFEFFIDGDLVGGQDPTSAFPSGNSTDNLRMGDRSSSGSNPDRSLIGNISAFLTYKRSITRLEICQLSELLAKFQD